MYVGLDFYRADWLGQQRLFAYQRFMSYYAGRDRCLALDPATHADNESLLATLKLLGPEDVARMAEEHYVTCSEVRADSRQANVPADWASRLDHSWVRFDRSRALLVGQMSDGLPERYRGDFVAGGIGRDSGVSASTRSR